jgi:hypothetical protein
MKKLSIKAQKCANGGHHYVYVCKNESCGKSYSYNWLGKQWVKSHVKKCSYGNNGYKTKDVCTAYGKVCK